jgi:hypothetical protein
MQNWRAWENAIPLARSLYHARKGKGCGKVIEKYDIIIKTMLPSTLKRFFWDIPFNAIDRAANKNYIISRILELGDEAAVAWLLRYYSWNDVYRVVMTSRGLSEKSRNYWKLKYHVV